MLLGEVYSCAQSNYFIYYYHIYKIKCNITYTVDLNLR